jgi:hypothetical protein
MLDKLPAWARHLVFAVVPILLAWLASDIVPQFEGKPGVVGLVGVVLTMAIAFLTPVTQQYGVGAAVAAPPPPAE